MTEAQLPGFPLTFYWLICFLFPKKNASISLKMCGHIFNSVDSEINGQLAIDPWLVSLSC